MDWCCKMDSMWQVWTHLQSPPWCWLDNVGQWWTRHELKEGMLHPTLNCLTISLILHCMKTKKFFDSLPTICAPKITDLCNKLDRYLSTDPEHTNDMLLWWAEQRGLYLCLSHMALDYLLILGMSVYVWCCLMLTSSVATFIDVERMFSEGQILLSHLHNCLSVQLTWALMCLGAWSLMGYVWDSNVKAVTMLPELKEDEEEEPLKENWDLIQ